MPGFDGGTVFEEPDKAWIEFDKCLLAHSLAHHNPNEESRFRQRFDGVIERLRENVIGRVVNVAIRWRYLTVGIIVAVFIISVGMLAAGFLKYKAFPDIDGNVIMAHILLPQGTPLERTEELVTRLTDAIDEVDTEFTPLGNLAAGT